MANENNNELLTGAFNILADYLRRTMENSLPCKVVAVSDDRKTVTVQPLIKIVTTDGTATSRANISGVPVFTNGSSNWLISFPISVGDIGWLDACDRDISIFLQSYKDSAPATKRKHSFSDARFVPDIMTNYSISAEDSDAMVIQSADGSVKISLNESRIKMVAPSIEIEGDTTITGNVATTGTLTNNGIYVGSTHTHAQGNDSDGNSQVETETPSQ
jgi:hypothetical protein